MPEGLGRVVGIGPLVDFLAHAPVLDLIGRAAAWRIFTVAARSELTQEWLDPARPQERAEQIVLQQGGPAENFE